MDEKKTVRKRPAYIRILKWTGVALLTVMLLILAAITVAVSYLKPERLTPIVRTQAE